MERVIEFIEKAKTGEPCVIAGRMYVAIPVSKGAGKIIYVGRCPDRNGISNELMKLAIMDFKGIIHCYAGVLEDMISYDHRKDPLPDGVVRYSSGEFTDTVHKRVTEMCKHLDYDMNDLTLEQYEKAKELAIYIAIGYSEKDVLDRINISDLRSEYEDYLLGLTTCDRCTADYFENNKDNLIGQLMIKEKAKTFLKAYSKQPEMQFFDKIDNLNNNPKYLTLNLEINGKTASAKIKTAALRNNIYKYTRYNTKKQIISSVIDLMTMKDDDRIQKELNTSIHDITFDDLESVIYNGKTLYKRNKDS